MEFTSQNEVTVPLNYKDRLLNFYYGTCLWFVKDFLFIFYLNNILYLTE